MLIFYGHNKSFLLYKMPASVKERMDIMKRKKKILSLLLAMAVILAFAPMAYAVEATGTIVPDYSWYSESADSYTLENAEDFLGFANLVNGEDGKKATDFAGKSVNLNGTIDFNNQELVPVGNAGEADRNGKFKGNFNGNGNVIKNVVISSAENMGVFGFVENGSIKNVTFEGVVVSKNQLGKEPAAGVAVGSVRNSTLENIKVESSCSVNAKLRAGGIVGSARGKSTSILSCENKASITGEKYTGGIVGALHDITYSQTGAVVKECKNYGVINGVNEVGGIAGYADKGLFTDCENRGSIKGTGNYGTGGILGFDAFNEGLISMFDPKNGSVLTNCDNYAEVDGLRSGGIVGTYGTAPGDEQADKVIYCKIINCDNSGNITGTAGKCGTIFGYQISYKYGDADDRINNLYVEINNCTNSGSLNGETGESAVFTSSNFVSIVNREVN